MTLVKEICNNNNNMVIINLVTVVLSHENCGAVQVRMEVITEVMIEAMIEVMMENKVAGQFLKWQRHNLNILCYD